jgi:hypothetical protein
MKPSTLAKLNGTMPPEPRPADAVHLSQAHFKPILNLEHPLAPLADKTDWPRFDAASANRYREELGATDQPQQSDRGRETVRKQPVRWPHVGGDAAGGCSLRCAAGCLVGYNCLNSPNRDASK